MAFQDLVVDVAAFSVQGGIQDQLADQLPIFWNASLDDKLICEVQKHYLRVGRSTAAARVQPRAVAESVLSSVDSPDDVCTYLDLKAWADIARSVASGYGISAQAAKRRFLDIKTEYRFHESCKVLDWRRVVLATGSYVRSSGWLSCCPFSITGCRHCTLS
jgi:hypothetical protein